MKSRKFWVAILSAIVVTAGEQFGLELDPEQVISLAGLASLYILGQAQVDKSKVQAEVEAGVAQLKQEANAIISLLSEKLEAVQADSEIIKPSDANTELYQG